MFNLNHVCKSIINHSIHSIAHIKFYAVILYSSESSPAPAGSHVTPTVIKGPCPLLQEAREDSYFMLSSLAT